MFSQKLAGIGGSERYLQSIMPELARRGVDTSFLLIRDRTLNAAQAEFIDSLKAHSISTSTVVTLGSITPLSVWRYREVLRRVQPDVLQTNLIHADAHGALCKMLMTRPPVLVSMKHGFSDAFQAAHGFNPAKVTRNALSLTTWAAARRADSVVSISMGLANLFTGSGLVDEGKSRVIPYGFDFAGEPSLSPKDAYRRGVPQIVTVGRLVEVKQFDLLIGAMPRLVETFPDLKLVLVGDGPLRGPLEQLAASRGVSRNVVFAGFAPNVLDYIRDSDVFALTSAAEGFGRVILEAWWHKKPVVCFDVPAPNEIIVDGVNGVLVPPRDTAGLTAALSRLLANAEERHRLGEEGRHTYESQYTINAMIDRTLALYEEMLTRGPAVPRS